MSASASTSAAVPSAGPTAYASSSSSQSPAPIHPLRRRLSTIAASDHLYLRLPSGAIKYVKPWGSLAGSSTTGTAAAAVQEEQEQDGQKQGGAEAEDEAGSSAGGAATAAATPAPAPASGRGKRSKKPAPLRTTKVVSLGKFGNFDLQDLEGVPFGWTWEIGPPKAAPAVREEAGEVKEEDTAMEVEEDPAGVAAAAAVATRSGAGKQQKGGKGGGRGKKGGASSDLSNAPGALRIMVGTTLSELEETNATNEDIFDDPTVAPRLTMVDVQALRDSGLEGQELIDELTKASSSFEKRTVWSQDKFIKKKEAKHLKLFTPLPPSVAVMAEYHFERSPEKVRGLRVDALAQMLSFAGVAPGGRYLVVDGTSGLLTAACLDRMGGHGRLLAIHDNDSVPEFDIVRSINFPAHVVDDVLRTLHWAQVDRDYQHPYIPPMPERLEDAIKDSGAEGLKAFRARERERHRMGKKYAAKAELDELREEFFEGDFDGVLTACGYEPVSIISSLLPYLAGSAQICVHSPLLQPLVEAHAILRASHEIVNLSLTEPWLRRYQVLPGRTHPEMNTSATGGYILHGIRVLTDEMAREEMRREEEREKTGTEAEGGEAGTKATVVPAADVEEPAQVAAPSQPQQQQAEPEEDGRERKRVKTTVQQGEE